MSLPGIVPQDGIDVGVRQRLQALSQTADTQKKQIADLQKKVKELEARIVALGG